MCSRVGASSRQDGIDANKRDTTNVHRVFFGRKVRKRGLFSFSDIALSRDQASPKRVSHCCWCSVEHNNRGDHHSCAGICTRVCSNAERATIFVGGSTRRDKQGTNLSKSLPARVHRCPSGRVHRASRSRPNFYSFLLLLSHGRGRWARRPVAADVLAVCGRLSPVAHRHRMIVPRRGRGFRRVRLGRGGGGVSTPGLLRLELFGMGGAS